MSSLGPAVTVFAPATVANVASGFDIFGFALETPGDILTARFCDKAGVTLQIRGDEGKLSCDPLKNAAGVGVLRLLEYLKTRQGVLIQLEKYMPFASGLGSSAASAAGSVYAVNQLLGNPFSLQELVSFAMEAEKMVSGAGHPDNVAAALFGGFVLIRSCLPLDIVPIPLQLDLFCAIFHPNIEIPTKQARQLLKKTVPLTAMVEQTGNAAGLIAGLLQSDVALIARSLEDVVIEPQRASLVPGFYDIKRVAGEAGALGCSLSGSGPSVFAITITRWEAENAAEAMKQAAKDAGLDGQTFVSAISRTGAHVL